MKNLIALLLFSAAAAGWYFYNQHQKARSEVAEISANLHAFEQTLEARRQEERAYSTLVEAQKKHQQRGQAAQQMDEKLRQAKDAVNSLSKERLELISSVRQSWVGQVIPELVLKDGRKLLQAKVLKVDDSGLSVGVSFGIQKVAVFELPVEMRQRLYFPQ